MYETFFNFSERPFAASARIDRYYPGEAAETVRLAAARCIERAEGYAVILGPSGTGKTLLCQVLAEQFRKTLSPVFLTGGQIASRKALLQGILFELGLPFKRREEGELRLALLDRIAAGRDKSEGLLLLVDEAQSLRPRLFEELRLLSNVVRQGKSSVRLVFAGTARLEERIAHPKLAAFQQRVAARCTLRPFSAAETQEYVRAQTAVVGGDPDAIWGADALLAIHSTTDGVPRLINQVCDYALLMAAAGGARHIDASGIEEAWADLQQLPLPSDQQESKKPSRSEGESEAVIEFGMLEDDLLESIEATLLTGVRGGENALLPDADDDFNAAISDETQVELVFGDEPRRRTATEQQVAMADIESSDADDAVYHDYPIITRAKSMCETTEQLGGNIPAPKCEALEDEDVDDWVPVPIAQGSGLVRPRGNPGDDPVLPETAAVSKIIPLRGNAPGPFGSVPIVDDESAGQKEPYSALQAVDADDIVLEEDVPAPTYCPDGRTVWPTTFDSAATQRAQARREQNQPRPKRVFGQLFSKMQRS